MSDPSKPKHLAYVPEDKLLELRVWNEARTHQGTVKAKWLGQYQERYVRIEWDNDTRTIAQTIELTRIRTVEPI